MQNTKRTILTATIIGLTIFGMAVTNAQKLTGHAEKQAINDFQVQVAVATASKAWKNAFNEGNAIAAAALYEENAVMVVKPYGTFKGRAEILAFWTDLVNKGFDDVVYSNTVMTILDGQSARIESDWKMNSAHGVITNELWIIQPDGRALLREDHFEVAQ